MFEANLILLQETHSIEQDAKFWKMQWAKQIYFNHGTNHSARVKVYLHKFRGDVTSNDVKFVGSSHIWIQLLLS